MDRDRPKSLWNHEWLLLTGILLTAFAVRVYRLGTYSFWGDEADAIYAGIYKIYFHPPLFGFLVKHWIKVAHTDFSIRFLVTIFSLCSIAATWFLARRILDSTRGAFWASLFMALAPSQVYHGRELRMYSLLTAAAALSWLTYFNWMRKGGFPRFAAVVITGSIVAYTHNYGLLLLASQGLSAFFMKPRRQSLIRLFKYTIGVFIIYVPFLAHLLYFVTQFLGSHFWAPPVTWKTPFYLLRFLLAGLEPPYWVAALLIGAGLGLFLIGLWKNKTSQLRLLIMFGMVLPVAMAVVLSMVLPSSTLVARYLIYTSIPLSIGMAAGVEEIRRFRAWAMWPLALLAGQFWAITLQYRNMYLAPVLEIREREQFRESCGLILDSCREGDVIGTTCMSGTHPVWYYITLKHGFPPTRMVDVDNLHREHLKMKYNLNEYLEDVYTIANPINIDEFLASGDYKRFWFYGTQWTWGILPGDFYYDQRVRIRKWLIERYPQIGEWEFKGVEVRLFDLEHPIQRAEQTE